MSYLTEDDEFRTICLNSAIIAENGMASSQSRAIIGSFKESATLLKNGMTKQLNFFPNELDLKDGIPDPSTLDVTRMLNGMIEHNTCYTARLQGIKLESLILDMAKEQGIKDKALIIYQGSVITICATYGWTTSRYFLGRSFKNTYKMIRTHSIQFEGGMLFE